MSRVFEAHIDTLSKVSGYGWNFLVNRYNEMIEAGEYDWDYFVGVTAERDWTVSNPLDLLPEERPIYNRLGERAWMNLANPSLAYSLLC